MSNGNGANSALSSAGLCDGSIPNVSKGLQPNARQDQDARQDNEVADKHIAWLKALGCWFSIKRTDIAIAKTECQLLLLDLQKQKVLIQRILLDY